MDDRDPRSVDELLADGKELHRAGQLPEARRLYVRALAESPTDAVAQFRLGLLELQELRPEAALLLIERAIAASPEDSRYQFGLGEVLAALRRWEDAAAVYRRVVDADPSSAQAHFALGSSLKSTADFAGAIISYQAAVQLQPDFVDAFNNLGNCHRLVGDFSSAEAAFREAIVLKPTDAVAASNLGVLLQEKGDGRRAIEMLRRAVELEPAVALHRVNLGGALCEDRQFTESAALFRSVLELDESNAEATYNLGLVLQELGEFQEAAGKYQQAVDLRPGYADAWNNLGNMRRELGELKLAAAAYDSAMKARPGFISAINNAAVLLRSLGRVEEAELLLREVLKTDKKQSGIYDTLGNILKDSGELEEAIECFRKALALDPSNVATHSNLVYSLGFGSLRAEPILEECDRWCHQHVGEKRPEIAGHSVDRIVGRRIRIGYISPDFRDHCQSLFTIPLLSNHDREKFEIFCYSSVQRPDDFTHRLSGHADCWREVRHLDDSSLFNLIRADGIDILVDLTMHMASGRPLLFARKPAPIQVAWLAYPGTTGLAAMDYRFSDPRLDPPGFDRHYVERTLHLPDSFWCYDPLTSGPEVNELPALKTGRLTLGSLNNPCKLTDQTIRLWSRVMGALPEARLLLMAAPGLTRQRLLKRFGAEGVDADRVSFVRYQPRQDYLQTYHQIDLGLDPFPYNGHTTSLDSLWMGVPVVTRVGQTCVGRGGLSQLFQLDLLELAADSDDEFVRIVTSLAGDLPRLGTLRKALRSRLEKSPLMDAKRFAGNIENAYQLIFGEHFKTPV